MFDVVGLEFGIVCVLLGFVSVSDKASLNDVLKKIFIKSTRWGCWKVEVHLFTIGFRLEDVIESTREAILNNIHLSLVLYDHKGLSDVDRILSNVISRIKSGDIKRVYIYISPGISRDIVEKVKSKVPSEYSEFLSRGKEG